MGARPPEFYLAYLLSCTLLAFATLAAAFGAHSLSNRLLRYHRDGCGAGSPDAPAA